MYYVGIMITYGHIGSSASYYDIRAYNRSDACSTNNSPTLICHTADEELGYPFVDVDDRL